MIMIEEIQQATPHSKITHASQNTFQNESFQNRKRICKPHLLLNLQIVFFCFTWFTFTYVSSWVGLYY